MTRPSEVHKYVVRYARALTMVEEFLGIDIKEMLRAVMLSVVIDPERGRLFADDQRQQYSASYLRPPESNAFQSQPIPKCIGRWLVGKVRGEPLHFTAFPLCFHRLKHGLFSDRSRRSG